MTAFSAAHHIASGALAGAVGVWVLDRVDWALYRAEPRETRERTERVRPGGEDPAHVLAGRLERAAGREVSPDGHRKLGDIVHLGMGIAPGVLYALLRPRFAWLGLGRGSVFGLSLFLLQDEGLNAATGLSARPQNYAPSTHLRGLLAHLAYGLTLDAVLRVAERRR